MHCVCPIMWKHDVIHKTGSRQHNHCSVVREGQATVIGNIYRKFEHVVLRCASRQTYTDIHAYIQTDIDSRWSNCFERVVWQNKKYVYTYTIHVTFKCVSCYVTLSGDGIITGPPMGQYCFARCRLSALFVVVCNARGRPAAAGPGAWPVRRPTLHCGTVRLRPVRGHLVIVARRQRQSGKWS